jgi:hypothetical protein
MTGLAWTKRAWIFGVGCLRVPLGFGATKIRMDYNR